MRTFSEEYPDVVAPEDTPAGSERWQTLRTGRISGSHCHVVSRHRNFATRRKSALSILRLDGERKDLGQVVEAVQWGVDHEDVAVECYEAALRRGVTIQVLDGARGGFGAKNLPTDVFVQEPDLELAVDVSLLLSREVWHLSGSVDALGSSSSRAKRAALEVKCPFTEENRRMSAWEYIRKKPAYQTQLRQYSQLLKGGIFVDFAVWSDDKKQRGGSWDPDLGSISVLRYVYGGDGTAAGGAAVRRADDLEVLVPNHVFAAHHVAPLLELLAKKGVKADADPYTRSRRLGKYVAVEAVCSGCGAERTCVGGCSTGACTCRCTVLCLTPSGLGLDPTPFTPCPSGCTCALVRLPDLGSYLAAAGGGGSYPAAAPLSKAKASRRKSI